MKVEKSFINEYGLNLETLKVELKGTTLLLIEGYDAFFLCCALDVDIYNSIKMIDRKVICGKAIGVKTIEELLNAPIHSICDYGKSLGLYEGMKVYEGFKKLSEEK